MATIKPAFKDYEYGWYGHGCSRNAHFMHSQQSHIFVYKDKSQKINHYDGIYNSIIKQLPKIQSVKFIYGNYKECI